MLTKRTIIVITIVLILTVPAGCWSRKEIERLAIITMMGFDKAHVDGQAKWVISAQVIRPGELSGGAGRAGSSGGGKPVWLVSSVGDTIIDAERNFSSRSPRESFIAQSNVLVIGEAVAREGMHELIDYIVRNRDIRLRSWLLVVNGKAIDVLRAEPEIEKTTSNELMGIINNSVPRISKAYTVTVKDFIIQLLSPGRDAVASRVDIFIPDEVKPYEIEEPDVPRGLGSENKPAPRLHGAAVFNKNRLVGWLEDRETLGLLYIVNKAQQGVISVSFSESGRKDVTFVMTGSQSRITPKINGSNIAFSIEIDAEGYLGENNNLVEISKPETLTAIEKKVSSEIKKMTEDVIQKAQQEYGADVFGLGDRLRKTYPRVWKDIEKDWDLIYPTVEVTLNVNAKIRRTGMTGDTPKIK
jgi:spore germination protein KC